MHDAVQTLQENFALLDDWEARYGYVLDLGKKLPRLDDSEKIESNIVRGCTSQVWLVQCPSDLSNTIAFAADSDAHIVRGLIAILRMVYHNQPVDFVRDFDIENFFASLGLGEHLSPSRRNGFFAMVGRIKGLQP